MRKLNNLNTHETFCKGYKIERNGEIIELTMDEMQEFRALNDAATALAELRSYKSFADADEIPVLERMMKDEEFCYKLSRDFADCQNNKEIKEVIRKYTKKVQKVDDFVDEEKKEIMVVAELYLEMKANESAKEAVSRTSKILEGISDLSYFEVADYDVRDYSKVEEMGEFEDFLAGLYKEAGMSFDDVDED